MASEDMARQFLRHFDPLISEWTGRTEVNPRALEVFHEMIASSFQPRHLMLMRVGATACLSIACDVRTPAAIVKLAVRQMSEREFIDGASNSGGWNSICFRPNCVHSRQWVPMSPEDVEDRYARCSDPIFESSDPGQAVPKHCSHHDPACELYRFIFNQPTSTDTSRQIP